MNSFGRIFRLSIFGESHGEAVGVVLDGVPAGMALHENDFTTALERRKGGGRGTTPRVEDDRPEFVSGLFNGYTTGAPLTIFFRNTKARSADYDKQKDIPRPGHADMVAQQKFNSYNDYRGGGHFSGRLTVCLVAAGVVAKKIIQQLEPGIKINADVIELAGEKDVDKGLDKAIAQKNSAGGLVECHINYVPVGLGEPFFDSFESVLSHLMFAIPAIKGIEFGAGFGLKDMYGAEANDAIVHSDGRTKTNHAGGINGGITNGNDVIFRVVVKPASSTPAVQHSLNISSGEMEDFSIKGRHDLAIALRVPVITEACAAIVLLDFLMIHKAIWKK